ncbi:MAG: DUF3445 domain-containing protein [Solirubrobacteraceae bacterium]|nr:DUF3445 domain-containing protein [Solirubrobacteraceae bacterium]
MTPHLTQLPATVAEFPFPFDGDSYMYSTNIEPAPGPRSNGVGTWGERVIVTDEHYLDEVRLRAEILERDPRRCQVMDHMADAAWDVVEYLCEQLAADVPEQFELRRDGDRMRWTNRPMGIEQEFVLGDPSTLPLEPFEWICRQVQEDIELLDQREGKLWFDAGILTFGADWSLDFDLGMSFLEIHGPVPRVHELGVLPRANQFLLRLRAGEDYRRTNWTLTIGRRLDTNTETYHEWGPDRSALRLEEIGERLHLRVEVQHFVRLPRSNAVMFPIHTYMLSFDEICTVPAWALRLQRVLATLPEDLVDYKGLTRFRDIAVDWLVERTGEAAA